MYEVGAFSEVQGGPGRKPAQREETDHAPRRDRGPSPETAVRVLPSCPLLE